MKIKYIKYMRKNIENYFDFKRLLILIYLNNLEIQKAYLPKKKIFLACKNKEARSTNFEIVTKGLTAEMS